MDLRDTRYIFFDWESEYYPLELDRWFVWKEGPDRKKVHVDSVKRSCRSEDEYDGRYVDTGII